ncbi:MAG: hypothetical protein ACOH5I_22740 [Oligoflexus sp.]
MSRNLSQSSAWIFAGLGSLMIFGLLLFWIMKIPGAHENNGQRFDSEMRISSDAYELPADEGQSELTIEAEDPSDEQVIRSDDVEEEESVEPDQQSNRQPSNAASLQLAAKQSPELKKKI